MITIGTGIVMFFFGFFIAAALGANREDHYESIEPERDALMRVLNRKETRLVVATLSAIDNELRRCYWNKNQMDLPSPFSNTGNSYSCDAFAVRAYDWAGDNGRNFIYRNGRLTAEWYKHLGRGDYVEVAYDWTLGELADMLEDCVEAIRRDFGE